MRKLIYALVTLIVFSCLNRKDPAKEETNTLLDTRFQFIKEKLEAFAKKHNAKISTAWSHLQTHDPDKTDSFLVRHIVWTDGRFGKAVLIQQHSDKIVDTTAWDFTYVAWLQDTARTAKPTYVNNLLTKVDFQIIEKNIERLLSTSEKNLSIIKVEDLK